MRSRSRGISTENDSDREGFRMRGIERVEQTRNRVSDRVSRRERGMSGLREEDERRESSEIKNLIFFFSFSIFIFRFGT